MKREVVEDFLNLPGIAGVALMDGRSRPYFCGVDNTLNFQQKEALAQGIRQVVETTPEGFESFEFQFTAHRVYIYKLAQGMILLVLTSEDLVDLHYLGAVEKLKMALQENLTTAIATFRLLAGSITLSSQSYWKSAPQPPVPQPASPSSVDSGRTTGSRNGFKTAPPSPNSSVPPSLHPLSSEPEPQQQGSQVTLKEILLALNHLSEFTTHYLGTAVIANYWKSSRPEVQWLNEFHITRGAEITFGETTGSEASLHEAVDLQQIQWIQAWVSAFITRCTRVIRDFPLLVEQTALSEQQKKLLLP
ncbi:hypothetical protein H6G20_16510 [Desertifilum sp. FACHB-1129]|uniref:Uncharacterized protein n=1 Tax=Desertifilum tharense IPPAS B-1220 TaxID=1781255 RepID=A0A1E5QLL4_9CYAN|nr:MULTISPECIES: hypothetical protein [Desertifilum]MDA0212004.1 hypothetical protein [Cyanobacteria bacterium FC1]MBD2313270.1 hypothetical protein [Desertifilum sp. FACHB-1129]MBD2324269.1 hypothetical protein [Desertifilum sp. FACHB-866]MBD2334284.1 hypothetical protein [Desertifilum sp. FACHB-868]OEJ75582.1 hypothetical protein BH720_08700 [Desertifilum tharense IPPAS B-1220]